MRADGPSSPQPVSSTMAAISAEAQVWTARREAGEDLDSPLGLAQRFPVQRDPSR